MYLRPHGPAVKFGPLRARRFRGRRFLSWKAMFTTASSRWISKVFPVTIITGRSLLHIASTISPNALRRISGDTRRPLFDFFFII